MFLPPLPSRRNDGAQVGLAGCPAESRFRFRGISDQARRIAWARRLEANANVAPGDLPRAFDDLQNRITVPRAEIQKIGFAVAAQMPERTNVRVGEIGHMDVIANRSTVRRWIVLAEHRHVERFSLRGRQS